MTENQNHKIAQAYQIAQDAFDQMANHPGIWLTHGHPSLEKEKLIVYIIADSIIKAGGHS